MTLSSKNFSRLLPLLGSTVAVFALLLGAGRAVAQPRIPADARGYQIVQIQQEYAQRRAQQRAAAAVTPVAPRGPTTGMPPPDLPLGLSIAVSTPADRPEDEPVVVDIQGPDGKVRAFPLEGGRETVRVRQVVVRPGETVTLRVRVSPPK
jgi:hypothetical protein